MSEIRIDPLKEKEKQVTQRNGLSRLSYESALLADNPALIGSDDLGFQRMRIATQVLYGDFESAGDIESLPLNMTDKAALFVDLSKMASTHERRAQYVPYFLQNAGDILQLATRPDHVAAALWVSRIQKSHNMDIAPILQTIDHALARMHPNGLQERSDIYRMKLARNTLVGDNPATGIDEFLQNTYLGLLSRDTDVSESLSEDAAQLMYQRAKDVGIGQALDDCKNIQVLESRINAYMGVSALAAETNDEQFLRTIQLIQSELASPEEIRGHDHKAYVRILDTYHQTYPVWLLHPEFVHILDFSEKYFPISWKKGLESSFVHAVHEQVYALYVVQQRIDELETSSAQEECASLVTLHQWQDMQIRHIKENFDHIPSHVFEDDSRVYELAESLPMLMFTNAHDVVDVARVSSDIVTAIVEHGEEWWPKSVGDIIKRLVYTEPPHVIHALIPYIQDGDVQADVLGKLLVTYGAHFSLEQPSQTWTDEIEQNLRMTETMYELELLGWQTDVLHQKKLEKLDVPLQSKIAFLIGLSHHRDWKQKAITFAVSLLKQSDDRDLISYFFSHLKQHYVSDKFMLDKIFEFMDYKKSDNYLEVERVTPQMVTGVQLLLELNNEKGKMLAMQLFSNDVFTQQYPDERLAILRSLVDANVISKKLIDLMARHAIGHTISEHELNFIAMVYRDYRVICSESLYEIALGDDEIFDFSRGYYQLLEIYALSDEEIMQAVQNPIERSQYLVTSTNGIESYYLRNGQLQYLTVNDHPLKTWRELLQRTSMLGVDSKKLNEFETHLIEHGFTQSERTSILDRLILGLHPIDHATIEASFINTENEGPEALLFEIQDIIQRKLWGFRQLERMGVDVMNYSIEEIEQMIFSDNFFDFEHAADIDAYMLDFSHPYEVGKLEAWALERYQTHVSNALSVFSSSLVQNSQHPYVVQSLESLTDKVGNILTNAKTDYKSALDSNATTVITFIEKASNICRYAWASGAVNECVASNQGENHISYMSRRLADPFSWTIDMYDTKIAKIIGSCEMWLAFNPGTQSMELCCVGVYSGNKTKKLSREVLQFIERTIARPLKLGAVNMAQVMGGVIPTATGYDSVEGFPLVAFSPVVFADGSLAYFRGDDIFNAQHGDDAWHNAKFTYTEEFQFKGIRKVLRY